MTTAKEVAYKAGDLVGGDRATQHGTKEECFGRMAAALNFYCGIRREPLAPFTAVDTAHIMALWKLVRTQTGSYNTDDWIDLCGYSACASELASSALEADKKNVTLAS